MVRGARCAVGGQVGRWAGGQVGRWAGGWIETKDASLAVAARITSYISLNNLLLQGSGGGSSTVIESFWRGQTSV